MKKLLFSLSACSLFWTAFPSYAAIEKDLGQGLSYFRVTDAKTDLPAMQKAIEQHSILVLDLRSLSAEPSLADALQHGLSRKPTTPSARFVLINGTTEPSVITALDAHFECVVTLGPDTKAIKPDVAVHISEQEDQKGYLALANGTALEKLIADTPEKRRYDEAKLVHDHANGVPSSEAEAPPDAEDDTVSTEPEKKKKTAEPEKPAEPVVHDLVLERAVQLHRSLLALKRL